MRLPELDGVKNMPIYKRPLAMTNSATRGDPAKAPNSMNRAEKPVAGATVRAIRLAF